MRACSAHTRNRRILSLAGCALQVLLSLQREQADRPYRRCPVPGTRRTPNPSTFASVREAPIGTVWRRSQVHAGLSRAILDDPEKARRGREPCRPWPLPVAFFKTLRELTFARRLAFLYFFFSFSSTYTIHPRFLKKNG